MELSDKIKNALIEMEFVKRYEELSKVFNSERTPSDKRLNYIDCEEVKDTIRSLGYSPKFDAKEKFFKIQEETIDTYTFGVHIILRGGAVELVWVVRENGVVLLGSPWGTYAKRMIAPSYRIRKPVFGTYEELDEILGIAFVMYEDFKCAVVG